MIRNKRKRGNNRPIKEGMTGLKPPGKALSVIGAIRRQHFIAGALADEEEDDDGATGY